MRVTRPGSHTRPAAHFVRCIEQTRARVREFETGPGATHITCATALKMLRRTRMITQETTPISRARRAPHLYGPKGAVLPKPSSHHSLLLPRMHTAQPSATRD